ncbi:DUF5337 family protein [Jannaschia ovalis]|uniref:DUF5337 family protein n=1 Tax=Jannaschia ovalis TaxID=3038773 RepID=A0ABY8L8F4_9RHOB|nr:DUF5337 family protein [Jannaschia sp. GRR-S6-38]WGH77649.1 DUF5337 family protein [Jannaschia sp. GRR-S6-38]
MTGPSDTTAEIARRQRRVAMLIIGTFVIWVPMQALGAYFGLPVRLMGLIDIAALAVLAWALILLVGVWRMRRKED